jgi:hypothetical protein
MGGWRTECDTAMPQGLHSKLCASARSPSGGDVRVWRIGLSQLMHLGPAGG